MIGNHLSTSIMRMMREIIPLDCNIQLIKNTFNASFELDQQASDSLLIIIQEALTNCAAHSNAQVVTCNIGCIDTSAKVRIIDNGTGLAPGFKKRAGIAKMETYAAKINGEIHICNRCDLHEIHLEGTEVVITIPKNIKPAVPLPTL